MGESLIEEELLYGCLVCKKQQSNLFQIKSCNLQKIKGNTYWIKKPKWSQKNAILEYRSREGEYKNIFDHRVDYLMRQDWHKA